MRAWYVALAVWMLVAIGFFVILLTRAGAAEPTECHKLGEQLGLVVLSATDDQDLQQAVSMSAEARCILMDEPPLVLRVTPNTDASLTVDPEQAAKNAWCRTRYGSYREADGSVLLAGKRQRVPCPFKG